MTLDDQHVLVTGGAGFIGSHVTRALLEDGADVSVVDNFFAGEPGYVPDEVTRHEVDIRSDECAEIIVEAAPDIVVHLAALHYIPYCNDNPEEAFEVNVMGTRNLLEAAREVDGLERVVYASSAAVYPPRDGSHAETDQPGPTDIYGRSKLVGEDLLELFAAETDVPAATARLFNTYGTNETNPHLVPAILDQLEDGNRTIELGNLKPARDFIHAEDIAGALVTLAAYDNDGYRAYNVGTGTEHTVREVAEQVGEALGEDLTITQDEERVRESDRPHLCADISRITRETDWKPQTEFVDGLRGLLKAEGLVE